ncbi:hypothetical protein GCT13_15990 [Paraburkholderia sp. CNPSo 3157]|uniref:Uncharacterized protein n=1 Tax=Paraburkholderia franconis TaxID=2654983 RepID=A0A7X1TGH1_9BURK|nr:hypothetical protein [Paraburkholderia franconis]MPW18373.1 hypothetical protein [Paraburkholderia franconis]
MIHTINTLRPFGRKALARIGAAVLLAASAGVAGTALAQNAASESSAPMVKPPPAAASGTASATNPDNMPVKKPRKPTNDKMMHNPPASATNAR